MNSVPLSDLDVPDQPIHAERALQAAQRIVAHMRAEGIAGNEEVAAQILLLAAASFVGNARLRTILAG